MRDCENVDVRERLPELLHEQLRGAERERVLAHLSTCDDCTSELALLRAAFAAVAASAPRVNVAAIARAVEREIGTPVPPSTPVIQLVTPRVRQPRRWTSSIPLRAAAAFALMATGAAGVLLARREAPLPAVADTAVPAVAAPALPAPSAVVAIAPSTPREAVSESSNRATPSAPQRTAVTSSALGATFSDLSDEELAVVLRAIDDDGSLPADPAPTPTLVTPEDDR